MSISKYKSGERGSALLAVLWMSAALAAIGYSVSATVRSETDRVSTSSDGLRTAYLASGSVERGIQWMMWGGDYRNPDGTPRFWENNLPRMLMSYPSGDAVVEMIPESAKMNLNFAPAEDLYRVILAVGGDPGRARALADAIVDWRSGGGMGVNSFDPFNLSQGPTFRPRHASFQEIEELLLVQGMTPELYYGNFVADAEGRLYARGGLRDCLSIWGSSGPFDANTASPALMEAVGVPPAGVGEIVKRRMVHPFKNTAELGGVGVPVPRLGIGGNLIWTLRASARLRRPDGIPSEVVRTSAAVVKIMDRRQYFQMPVQVLRYYSDAWAQTAVVPPAVALPPFPGTLPGGNR
jgi:general secretion pathway protein K